MGSSAQGQSLLFLFTAAGCFIFVVFQEKHYVLLILWCIGFASALLHLHQAGCNSGGTG